MKYLIITPYFPTDSSFRGSFIFDQVMALKRACKDVAVFSPSRNRHPVSYDFKGIRVNMFHSRETPSYLFNGYFNDYNKRKFLSALDQAGIDINEIEVAHCHTGPHGIYGLALKELNPKIKVYLQHHGKDPYTVLNGKLAGWKANFKYRATNSINIFNKVDLHICISDCVRENLVNFPGAGDIESYPPYLRRLKSDVKLPEIKEFRCVTLYNGVDTRKFYPKNREPHKQFVIGCVGNFNYLKGQLDLIKAAEIIKGRGGIPNLKLVFIGSGETLNDCHRYVASHRLGDIVEFQSERAHEALNDVFNGFDLFVLPTRFEGFGCVFTEAAACGVPFMVCRGQGATEYIAEDELDMWTIEPGDYRHLAELIEDYHASPRPQKLNHDFDIDLLIGRFLSSTTNK